MKNCYLLYVIDIKKEAAKISAFSSGKINKYLLQVKKY